MKVFDGLIEVGEGKRKGLPTLGYFFFKSSQIAVNDMAKIGILLISVQNLSKKSLLIFEFIEFLLRAQLFLLDPFNFFLDILLC